MILSSDMEFDNSLSIERMVRSFSLCFLIVDHVDSFESGKGSFTMSSINSDGHRYRHKFE